MSYALPESDDNYSGRGLRFSRTVTYWRTRLCPALTHRWPVEGQQQYCLDGRQHDGQDEAAAQAEESLYYEAPDYSAHHSGKDRYDYAPRVASGHNQVGVVVVLHRLLAVYTTYRRRGEDALRVALKP
jgi:hypothetical protein